MTGCSGRRGTIRGAGRFQCGQDPPFPRRPGRDLLLGPGENLPGARRDADILEVGRSSVRIMVEVWINSKHDGEPIKVTEGEFVFVAIDENGRTRTV